MSMMVYVIVMSICIEDLYYYFCNNMSISSSYSKVTLLIKICDSHNLYIFVSMPYMFEDTGKNNQPVHSHKEHVCHHDDSHKHECSADDHNQVCGQCGKLHSKYFIENHHCICQTLFNVPSKHFEEYIVCNFHTRSPPSSYFI